MALYGNGVNYAKSIDPSSTNIIDPGLLGGKLRVFQDYATISGATNLRSDNYIIVGGKLPTGSQVVKIIVGCTSPALSTNSRIKIGDEGDDDRYMSTANATSTVTVTADAVAVGPLVAGGMYYTVTGVTDNYIRIAAGGKTESITAGTIKVSIFYVVE